MDDPIGNVVVSNAKDKSLEVDDLQSRVLGAYVYINELTKLYQSTIIDPSIAFLIISLANDSIMGLRNELYMYFISIDIDTDEYNKRIEVLISLENDISWLTDSLFVKYVEQWRNEVDPENKIQTTDKLRYNYSTKYSPFK